jgi:hypothetical protein
MIDAMKLALEALEYHQEQTRPIHKTQETIIALRQAIEQAEKPYPYQYVEVRIKVGDFHIKKAVTEMEFLKAYDPIKLLSLVADDCVQHLKEVL